MHESPLRVTAFVSIAYVALLSVAFAPTQAGAVPKEQELDEALAIVLREAGFTGRIESTLAQRLGRPLNPKLANLGRLLWFDVAGGLHDDNTCGGATRRPTAWATLSPSQSASRITIWWAPIVPVRVIRDAHPLWSTPRFTPS